MLNVRPQSSPHHLHQCWGCGRFSRSKWWMRPGSSVFTHPAATQQHYILYSFGAVFVSPDAREAAYKPIVELMWSEGTKWSIVAFEFWSGPSSRFTNSRSSNRLTGNSVQVTTRACDDKCQRSTLTPLMSIFMGYNEHVMNNENKLIRIAFLFVFSVSRFPEC